MLLKFGMERQKHSYIKELYRNIEIIIPFTVLVFCQKTFYNSALTGIIIVRNLHLLWASTDRILFIFEDLGSLVIFVIIDMIGLSEVFGYFDWLAL